MKAETLSIVIVTYNNATTLRDCLDSLPWDRVQIEVRLIDNRSTDATRESIDTYCREYPHRALFTVANPFNAGYAKGVNRGFRDSTGRFILLLGPDTVVYPDTLEAMMDYLQAHPDVGLVAPQLVDPIEAVQPSCRRFPTYADVLLELSLLPRLFPKWLTPRWKMPDFDHRSRRDVDQPEATCLMTHRGPLLDVGLMDERFPMFFNDVDWCHRFRLRAWRTVFLPEIRVRHIKGASVYANRIPMIWKSHQGCYRYFVKYNRSPSEKCINPLLGFILVWAAVIRSIPYMLGKRGRP